MSSVPLFSALNVCTLATLEAKLEWANLLGGWTSFHEDEVGNALYVMMAGVKVRDNDRHERPVASIQAGDTVREMALLDGGSQEVV
jgi:hypothetical protein